MTRRPEQIPIYHITDVENLPGILAAGGLRSDAAMADGEPTVIGYGHIKQRRMTEIRVDCCGGRFVGEFVPFYFCPRSPMLYTINRGNTGRSPGCQKTIIHLVSTIGAALSQTRSWAISDGNAGAFHTEFFSDLGVLSQLDWEAIRATQWQGRTHQKSAEFLLADFFAWPAIHRVGCQNPQTALEVQHLIAADAHRPTVTVENSWYY
jgi:hypothetical protein